MPLQAQDKQHCLSSLATEAASRNGNLCFVLPTSVGRKEFLIDEVITSTESFSTLLLQSISNLNQTLANVPFFHA